LPQDPQLLGSVSKLSQTPLQRVCKGPQAGATQKPAVQVLLKHCEAATQAAPFGKGAVHWPEAQIVPFVQTLLHWPQLLGSLPVLAQAPLQ
jgi:hypothetical protein